MNRMLIILIFVVMPLTAVGSPLFDEQLKIDGSLPAHLRPGKPNVEQMIGFLKQLKQRVRTNNRKNNYDRHREFVIECGWEGGIAVASDTNPGLVICFDRTMFE